MHEVLTMVFQIWYGILLEHQIWKKMHKMQWRACFKKRCKIVTKKASKCRLKEKGAKMQYPCEVLSRGCALCPIRGCGVALGRVPTLPGGNIERNITNTAYLRCFQFPSQYFKCKTLKYICITCLYFLTHTQYCIFIFFFPIWYSNQYLARHVQQFMHIFCMM